MHHTVFAKTDTNSTLRSARESGIRLIDSMSRKGAEGKNIGLLNPKSTHGVLLDFCSNL